MPFDLGLERARDLASHDDVVTPIAPRPPPRRPLASGLGRLVLRLAGFAVGLLGGLAVAAGLYVIWALRDLPNPDAVRAALEGPTLVFVDAEGREIGRRGPRAAPLVAARELPRHLVDAVVAVEDRRYFDHAGVDFYGVARAAAANARRGRVVQGGSTLTQQLVKNLFLESDRTMKRKVQEIALALWLERRFTKEEILERYLNRVYFGAGAWGVEAASQRYFGKSARAVTLPEAALLAGLLKAPSRYSPTNSVDQAERRATVALEVMVETGAITAAERDAAVAEPLRVKLRPEPALAGHFLDWAATDALAHVGSRHGVATVVTTLNLDMQKAAEEALRQGLEAAGPESRAGEAALVALEGDGAVRALVGGRNYAESQFNRATQGRRQPGSAFKPFVFAAALEAGLSPWDVREDAPVTIEGWTPSNYKERFVGPVTLLDALARSLNTVAVRVAEEVGRPAVAELAQRLGVKSTLALTPSLALGAHALSPLEMAQAYAAFANDGFAAPAYAVVEVRGPDGETLWARPRLIARRVLAAETAAGVNTMLKAAVEAGTGAAARLPGRPAAGKTGTTNDWRDAWFIGYVRGFAAAVWVGNDDYQPMAEVAGGTAPARIWRAFAEKALKDVPVQELPVLTPPPAPPPPVLVVEAAPPLTGAPAAPAAGAPEESALDALIRSLRETAG